MYLKLVTLIVLFFNLTILSLANESISSLSSGVIGRVNVDANICCGNGHINDEKDCKCNEAYLGPKCQYHSDGLYSCSSSCHHGNMNGNNECGCDEGWDGFNCDHPKCDNGIWSCGKQYCTNEEMKCICTPGYVGTKCDMKCPAEECKNGQGSWNEETCQCGCLGPWTGDLCDKCKASECENGMIQNEETCACTCPAHGDQCQNNGVMNPNGCTCDCVGNWKGHQCTKCKSDNKNCAHGGFWNDQICMCQCISPWDPSSNCNECPAIECEHGGEFKDEDCVCSCPDYWVGDTCNECPSEAELALKNIECGGKGFSRETCACNDKCPTKSCQNGSKQDEVDCECKCNLESKTKADIEATHWNGDSCTDCDFECIGEKEKLNKDKCKCDFFCPDSFQCMNGGTRNSDKCICECSGTWTGDRCEEKMDGSSEKKAATSCKLVLDIVPKADSGMYWIQPRKSEPAFQVFCEMSINGGGWTQLAQVKDLLTEVKITKKDFEEGSSSVSKDEAYILPCDSFSGMDGAAEGGLKNFIMLVTMGKVRDFFMPKSNADLCKLLTTQTNHAWSSLGLPPTTDQQKSILSSFRAVDIVLKEHRFDGGDDSLVTDDQETDNDTQEDSATTEMYENEDDEDYLNAASPSTSSFLESNFFPGWKKKFKHMKRLFKKKKKVTTIDPEGWTNPEYNTNTKLNSLLGGSNKGWPKSVDGREYLSFWGEGPKGGCCHSSSRLYGGSPDKAQWGQSFNIYVMENSGKSSDKKEGFIEIEAQVEEDGTSSEEEKVDDEANEYEDDNNNGIITYSNE